MALIKCPSCGEEISEKAFRCLYCGYEIEKSNQDYEDNLEEYVIEQTNVDHATKNTDYNKLGKISIIVGVTFWVIGFIKLFIFRNDIYGPLINAIYFISITVGCATLIISGVLIMIYDKLKK